MDYIDDIPEVLKSFLTYHETIKGHSRKTVDEYYLDLRTFFRFLKQIKGYAPINAQPEDIPISDVDIDFIKLITLSDVYSFLDYLSRERGLNANSRARKIACIRSFYKYLTVKAKLLDENPMQDLDSPKTKSSLPRYLSLEESINLLRSVNGENSERDYCILTLFLNCGLRVSELVGINLNDVRDDNIVITGKGNKERMVFLNDACISAINDYMIIRKTLHPNDKNALFISKKGNRVARNTVHELVKKHLLAAGLDSSRYSSHKLRHTAATLMLQNGVDVRTLQEVLGHENLNTTQIYTHVDNAELRMAAAANPLSDIKNNSE